VASLSKSEILAWYKRANARLQRRQRGKGGYWPRLTSSDREVYVQSIERHFSHLKRAFNERLRK